MLLINAISYFGLLEELSAVVLEWLNGLINCVLHISAEFSELIDWNESSATLVLRCKKETFYTPFLIFVQYGICLKKPVGRAFHAARVTEAELIFLEKAYNVILTTAPH